MDYYTSRLPNGIKLIHQEVNSPVAHCGLIVGTGSRDEEADEHGMAHFIEHAMFKGTKKRKAYHILSRLDDVGGEINAYTGKEETMIHASFFKEDYERAIELITDIVFNATYPEKEIEKEKTVIFDEINSYNDSPSELIFDDFEELVFNGNAIARGVLGSEKSVQQFSRQKLLRFAIRNYPTTQMVFSSVGNISAKKAETYFQKYFHSVGLKTPSQETRLVTNGYKPGSGTIHKNTYQAHCAIGNIAYALHDNQRYPMFVLNNLIAGPNLNSRVNLALREKHALAYHVESNYTPYSDTGIFMLYFGTDQKNLDKCIAIAYKEFNRLKKEALSSMQLSRAKKQILGQLAMSSESNEARMLSMSKSMLYYNSYPSFSEIQQRIENISSKQITETANEILDTQLLSTLIYR